jgi:hypothetical protein
LADSYGGYYIASPAEIVDVNSPEKVEAELTFLKNKLAKIKRYTRSLDIKLGPAEQQGDHERITALSDLLAKGYKRVARVNRLINAKQDELGALYANRQPDPKFASIESRKDKDVDSDGAPVALKEVLSDVTTSADINFDTNAQENQEIDQSNLSANLSLSKGPFYIRYTHSRNYTRSADDYFEMASDEWQGTVNNQITVGVSFSPDFGGDADMNTAKNDISAAAVSASSIVQ